MIKFFAKKIEQNELQTEKVFYTFAAHLEQYNPAMLPSSSKDEDKTFDEDGLLHSYDDKPIITMMESHYKTMFFNYTWYLHGKKYRADNKPVTITLDASEYATYDENGEMHSYNDMPSSVIYDKRLSSVNLTWHNHGMTHRDNNQPASIHHNNHGDEEHYYQNGFLHRDNSLPALVREETKGWFIQDVLHNTEGPANISPKSRYYPQGISDRGLYGVTLPKRMFNSIKTFSKESDVPLWLSFFINLGIVDVENVNMLRDSDTNKLDINLPVKWYLHFWNIAEENFAEAIDELDDIYFYYQHNSSDHLFNVLKVIEYEKSNLLTSNLQES